MARIKTTRLQKNLRELDACSTAVYWVNGKPPAVAWKNCIRPDWMLWMIAHLARYDSYYYRAMCSAVSVSIDVLVENGMITECDVCGPAGMLDAYATEFSVRLDRIGQGLRRRPSPRFPRDSHEECLSLSMIDLVAAAKLLNGPRMRGAELDFTEYFTVLGNLKPKIRRKICSEIRRVVRRPTLQEIESVIKKRARFDRYC